MSLNADPELLQDFLIEAGELLDGLDEQLIELERTPDDRALLNAVFRGLHTIKGGAGFLELHPLVEVCHRAEDVFNLLRNGERGVDAQLMDVMLRVLDTLKSMFVALREGEMPDHADAGLLRDLEALMSPAAPAVMAEASSPEAIEPAKIVVEPETEMAQATPTEAGNEVSQADLIGEDEFEQLLDPMYGQGQGPSIAAAGGMASAPSSGTAKADGAVGDLITEDEFEKLLDSLYGEGKGPSAKDAPAPSAQTSSAASDLITEDEFEKLLDSLYGEGKGPSAKDAPAP
ncbi:MAG: Hpt domain-containing protein, partial [Halothiobacillaceae bacterium]